MAWFQGRIERLRAIVAELVRRNVTPDKTGFADLVYMLVASYGLRTETAKDYVDTLIKAYKLNKWLSFIKYNDYLTEDEKQRWMEKFGSG